MYQRTQLCVIGVLACAVLASLWPLLALSGSAQAAKPDKPPGQNLNQLIVQVLEDPAWTAVSPLWAPASLDPDCVTQNVGGGSQPSYSFKFDHDLCATVVTSTGATLTDDVVCMVELDREGRVTELMLAGQDVIGAEGIMHVSDSIFFDPPIDPADYTDAAGVFTLHVHVDGLPIWKTDSHLISKKMKLVEMVGTIGIADIVYTPLP